MRGLGGTWVLLERYPRDWLVNNEILLLLRKE